MEAPPSELFGPFELRWQRRSESDRGVLNVGDQRAASGCWIVADRFGGATAESMIVTLVRAAPRFAGHHRIHPGEASGGAQARLASFGHAACTLHCSGGARRVCAACVVDRTSDLMCEVRGDVARARSGCAEVFRLGVRYAGALHELVQDNFGVLHMSGSMAWESDASGGPDPGCLTSECAAATPWVTATPWVATILRASTTRRVAEASWSRRCHGLSRTHGL